MTFSRQVSRRRAPRVSVDRPGRLTGRVSQSVTVIDLSLTGCLVRCGALLDSGAILDLQVTLDDGPLSVKVQVAESSMDGSRSAAEGDGCLAGLEFLGLPAREDARLRRFLDAERRRRRSADAPSH